MNVSFHGSHNATIAVEDDGEIILVLEFERFLNMKNMGIAQYNVPNKFLLVMEYAVKWVLDYLQIEKFDTCYYSSSQVYIGEPKYGCRFVEMHTFIPADKYVPCSHHISHAAGVFYQSPFKEALIFSFDGGGDDGKFNVYIGNRETGVEVQDVVLNPYDVGYKGPMNLPKPFYDLGFPYMVFAHYLAPITFQSLSEGNLVYPGKVMGLAGYGTVREEWIEPFTEFYKKNPDAANDRHQMLLDELGEKIGFTFDVENRITGQDAYDIAATSQRVFEECFLEIAKPFMDKYPTLPVCIAGGCGLNILLNTRLVEEFDKQVFVGPIPSDVGLAVGMIALHSKPRDPIDITYKGLPVLDMSCSPEYFSSKYPFGRQLTMDKDKWDGHTQVTYDTLCNDIINGKIIGVVRGMSEHGPRALGNRSILCNPSFSDMKDILNSKVKNREWYRPFAPVVRLEDVSKYFEWDGESRWMSFCPKVREEWREKLSAIVHIDGTARVQTITREQNQWLYDLLTMIDLKTGVGVLLNTSFNVNGKPILSTLKDAFHIYDTTQLDGVVVEDIYVRKEPFGVYV